MGNFDFEDNVGHWLLEGSQAYVRVLSEELAPHGITFRQCQVLSILHREGELSQAELADRMGLEPPTLVGVIDRMERGRWIARTPCANDRRKWLVQLTPAARDIWGTVAKCVAVVRKRATKGLTNDQLLAVRTVVDSISQNLAAESGGKAVSPGGRSAKAAGRPNSPGGPSGNRRGPRLK